MYNGHCEGVNHIFYYYEVSFPAQYNLIDELSGFDHYLGIYLDVSLTITFREFDASLLDKGQK
ncbi:hypothetical protein DB330_14155 [Lacticaseibacillus casei]|nr:hypothetical protein [Lacticaseibacillus casei]PTU90321.1 hypothetical protein DB330_14155 [Lacticaseibacillus casei]PTU90417.1 hypothetical protein DB326_13850 [Lacticaseibacillus casei]